MVYRAPAVIGRALGVVRLRAFRLLRRLLLRKLSPEGIISEIPRRRALRSIDFRLREHRRGKKHLEAAKESEARAEGRYCEVCALAFTGVVQFAEHIKGRKHKERAASRGALG